MSARTPQQTYLELQKLARVQGRNTQQLFELYIHERFLARLAESRFAEQFVLKGGMLLAVLDVRRPTRDADMLARGIASDEGNLRAVIGEIAGISMEDGVSFDATEISMASIREDADYEGVRLALPRTWLVPRSSFASTCPSAILSSRSASTTPRSWTIRTSGC